jgi:hypothetical protein
MAKVDKYVSEYKTEILTHDGRKFLVQYTDDANKSIEVETRKAILARRPVLDDYRDTPYFEKRCVNLLQKLWAEKDGHVFVETLVKNVGVSMSVHFRYRDVLKIIEVKKTQLTFDENDIRILQFIEKSLMLNNVIAPKIKAIYSLWNGDSGDDSND